MSESRLNLLTKLIRRRLLAEDSDADFLPHKVKSRFEAKSDYFAGTPVNFHAARTNPRGSLPHNPVTKKEADPQGSTSFFVMEPTSRGMSESRLNLLTKHIRRGLLAEDSDAVLLRFAPSARTNPRGSLPRLRKTNNRSIRIDYLSMEPRGIEPLTSSLPAMRSPS